jgi:ACS family hexuronate transporter-like MFS transporter
VQPGLASPSISARRGWAIALVATLAMSVSYLDRQVLAVLAPTVTRELAIGETAYGWLASAFSMAYLVGAPLAGQLTARVGVRASLSGAVLVWSVVAALHALVPSYWPLFALRIALGVAEAPSFPGAATSVQRALPADQRARGFGILFTGSSIGSVLAPLLATALSVHFGWRGAFLGTALVGLTWVPLWRLVTRGDAVRATLAPSPASPGSEAPSVWAALRDPAVQRSCAATLAAAPSIAFMLLWGAKYLAGEFQLSQEALAPYLMVPPVLFDLGAIAFGDLASRRSRRTGQAGVEPWLFAVAASLVLVLALAPWATTPLMGVTFVGIAMAGGGAVFALLTAEVLARVRPELVPVAPGVTAATQSLAYVIANPLLGWGVERTGGYALDCVAVALWIVPGALLWIFWPRFSAGSPARPAG